MELSKLSRTELRFEYEDFIREDKKIKYYTQKFEKMKKNNTKVSFNIWAFAFSTYWCFYRKMITPGAIALVLNFVAVYLSLFYEISFAAVAVNVGLSIVFGFFGNYLYMRHVEECISMGLDMKRKEKEKLYKDNGGDGTVILLGMIFVTVFVFITLFLSYGTSHPELLNTTTTA